MVSFEFIIPIVISIIALISSLYKYIGPDISLLTEEPPFKITDQSSYSSEEYTPRWLSLEEIILIFANYGQKGGTILDIKIDFTPKRGFREFMQDFSCNITDLPLTIKEGENSTIKFKPTIRIIDWKKYALINILKNGDSVENSVDRAIAEGKRKFGKFLNFLNNNEDLGEVSCTISLTTGRLWTKVRSKNFFKKVKVKNEFISTIDNFRKRLQEWDYLKPTRIELIRPFLVPISSLISELTGNLERLSSGFNIVNFTHPNLQSPYWDNLIKRRYDTHIEWFLINKEKGLEDLLKKIYRQISEYNSHIEKIMMLGVRLSISDFEEINKKRVQLIEDMEQVVENLKRARVK